MYVGVDIGGTKTLVAALDDNGVIIEKIEFKTPAKYDDFLAELTQTSQRLPAKDFRAGGVGMPGRVDRVHGLGTHFGNLGWEDVPLQADTEKIFHCPIVLENDARLAGLSESKLLPPEKRVLYITISTGIGIGFIHNQRIVEELADSEAGQMLLEFHGKRMPWEDFASGSAIVKRFGKKASEITDDETWQRIAHDLAQGFIEIIAITQPDIIVVGGSVGRYFDHFKDFLIAEIKKYDNPMLVLPVFQSASRPEDAVVYGCFDIAKERYGTTA